MELADYVRWAKKQQPYSRLGFFSQPVLATTGPLAEQMLKVYPATRKKAKALRLQKLHVGYVRELAATGRRIPLTRMEIVDMGRTWVPMIIQEAFGKDELIRQYLEAVPEEAEYRRVLGLVLEDTIRYLEHRAIQPHPPLGFHPTLRNYALRLNKLYYFDTFPPMNLSQRELNRLIRDTLPQAGLRLLARVYPPMLNRVSHEYYDATAMVSGIVGSACRLRPEWAERTLEWCRTYLQDHLPDALPKQSILDKIQEKPKLSVGWTTIRKLTNNIGKPNI